MQIFVYPHPRGTRVKFSIPLINVGHKFRRERNLHSFRFVELQKPFHPGNSHAFASIRHTSLTTHQKWMRFFRALLPASCETSPFTTFHRNCESLKHSSRKPYFQHSKLNDKLLLPSLQPS